MRIGVPAEIKNNEYRVGMTPSGAQDLTSDGHNVFVQAGAGNGSGFGDDEYIAAGATKFVPYGPSSRSTLSTVISLV